MSTSKTPCAGDTASVASLEAGASAGAVPAAGGDGTAAASLSSAPAAATPAAAGPLRPDLAARLLARTAIGLIAAALLIMIAASLTRGSWMFPHLVMPAAGPPWELRPDARLRFLVIPALWGAAVAAAAGVAAGLVALRRGARPSLRALLLMAAAAVVTMVLLPPAGSTDALDYAAYGRLIVLGHSPYVLSPYHLRLAHDAFASSVPHKWQHNVSVYGPLATAEQFLAARLAGASPARAVFWLKLWNALAFGLVAWILDRQVRRDAARRVRAHLLWTANPLLFWALLEGGHLDVLAAAAGLLALLIAGGAARRAAPRAAAAGALLGTAIDIKINYVLFGLGLAWALRKSPRALAAAAGGALAVLLPGYAAFGAVALRAVLRRRNTASADTFYQLFLGARGDWQAHIVLAAVAITVLMTVLLCWRLPPGDQGRPAIRPALAASAAWLFFWPYQLPWYDTMLLCLLVLYPLTWLDGLVLARLAAGTLSNLPGNPWPPPGRVLAWLDQENIHVIAPGVLLAAAAMLVAHSRDQIRP
ncbi:MAG: hypothetical protein ACLP52_01410 [Streptosporangiaceae bacterium]